MALTGNPIKRLLNALAGLLLDTQQLPIQLKAVCKRCLSYFFNSANDPLTIANTIQNNIIQQHGQEAPYPAQKILHQNWPKLDISVITHNSQHWIHPFIDSLLNINYPKGQISIVFVDNSPNDASIKTLNAVLPRLEAAGFLVRIIKQPNNGFGAGHNAGIRAGSAPWCLVSNIDLTYEPDTLNTIIAAALSDDPMAAAWETRQKPYEHPKLYNPITGSTAWCSHACVLFRRSAFEAVGGYDENLFMYGEDVELSFRFREANYLIRYCPSATVWHYTYARPNEIKPLQHSGGIIANLYLRLKYGSIKDMSKIPILMLTVLLSPTLYPDSRKQGVKSLLQFMRIAPSALLNRKKSNQIFHFYTWGYEVARDGAFVTSPPLPKLQPLVSVIIHTKKGRETWLKRSLLTVLNQTWSNIEIIIYQKEGSSLKKCLNYFSSNTNTAIKYIGSRPLLVTDTMGKWRLQITDNCLLFRDHVETLATAIMKNKTAVGSYSSTWALISDNIHSSKKLHTEQKHYAALFNTELASNLNLMDSDENLCSTNLIGAFPPDQCIFIPKITSIYT
jgi:GT2 family glycosyltransferase